jgi:ornithine carbamoyltransferase
MGFEAENEERMKAFADWCVDAEMMSVAHKEAVFMHCLPAHIAARKSPPRSSTARSRWCGTRPRTASMRKSR